MVGQKETGKKKEMAKLSYKASMLDEQYAV